MARGMFDIHPILGRDQPVVVEMLADIDKVPLCHCKVEHPTVGLSAGKRLGEVGKAAWFARIHRDKLQPLGKRLPVAFGELVGRESRGEILAHSLDECAPVQFGSRGGDDPAVIRELAGAMTAIERWQQLAHGKIAGGAKQHEVERSE